MKPTFSFVLAIVAMTALLSLEVQGQGQVDKVFLDDEFVIQSDDLADLIQKNNGKTDSISIDVVENDMKFLNNLTKTDIGENNFDSLVLVSCALDFQNANAETRDYYHFLFEQEVPSIHPLYFTENIKPIFHQAWGFRQNIDIVTNTPNAQGNQNSKIWNSFPQTQMKNQAFLKRDRQYSNANYSTQLADVENYCLLNNMARADGNGYDNYPNDSPFTFSSLTGNTLSKFKDCKCFVKLENTVYAVGNNKATEVTNFVRLYPQRPNQSAVSQYSSDVVFYYFVVNSAQAYMTVQYTGSLPKVFYCQKKEHSLTDLTLQYEFGYTMQNLFAVSTKCTLVSTTFSADNSSLHHFDVSSEQPADEISFGAEEGSGTMLFPPVSKGIANIPYFIAKKKIVWASTKLHYSSSYDKWGTTKNSIASFYRPIDDDFFPVAPDAPASVNNENETLFDEDRLMFSLLTDSSWVMRISHNAFKVSAGDRYVACLDGRLRSASSLENLSPNKIEIADYLTSANSLQINKENNFLTAPADIPLEIEIDEDGSKLIIKNKAIAVDQSGKPVTNSNMIRYYDAHKNDGVRDLLNVGRSTVLECIKPVDGQTSSHLKRREGMLTYNMFTKTILESQVGILGAASNANNDLLKKMWSNSGPCYIQNDIYSAAKLPVSGDALQTTRTELAKNLRNLQIIVGDGEKRVVLCKNPFMTQQQPNGL